MFRIELASFAPFSSVEAPSHGSIRSESFQLRHATIDQEPWNSRTRAKCEDIPNKEVVSRERAAMVDPSAPMGSIVRGPTSVPWRETVFSKTQTIGVFFYYMKIFSRTWSSSGEVERVDDRAETEPGEEETG